MVHNLNTYFIQIYPIKTLNNHLRKKDKKIKNHKKILLLQLIKTELCQKKKNL